MSGISEDGGITSGRRRRFGLRAAASVLAAVAVGSVLNAGAVSAANQYGTEVANRYNGMCLDVAHASTAAGAQVVQAGCWGGTNQAWKLQYVDWDWWTGVTYYQLRAVHSSQCLDVDSGSHYDGARISQWHCYGGQNQQFRKVHLGYGQYRLEARHSGKCVSAEASYRHAAAITQQACNNSTTQQWALR